MVARLLAMVARLLAMVARLLARCLVQPVQGAALEVTHEVAKLGDVHLAVRV